MSTHAAGSRCASRVTACQLSFVSQRRIGGSVRCRAVRTPANDSPSTSGLRRETVSSRQMISLKTEHFPLSAAHTPLQISIEPLPPLDSADSRSACDAFACLLLEITASVGPTAWEYSAGNRCEAFHASSSTGEAVKSPPKSAGRAVLDQVLSGVGERGRGLLMLNLLVLLWATNWSIVKTGGEAMDPLLFSGLRFSVAGLVFLPWLSTALRDKQIMKIGMELGVLNFLGYGTQAISLGMTTASKAAFLSTFAVLAVPMMACLNGRSVSVKTLIAGVGTLAGVALLEQGGGPGSMNMGDAWALLSALLFGLQIYRTEVHTRRLSGPEKHLPMASATMSTLAVLSLCSLVATHPGQTASLLAHSPQDLWHCLASATASMDHLEPVVAGSVLYTGLATTAMPMWLEITALQDVEASDCAVIYAMEPLLGAGIAWITLGERWGPIGWAGVALIMASNLSVQLGSAEEQPAVGDTEK